MAAPAFAPADRAVIRSFQTEPPVKVVELALKLGLKVWMQDLPDGVSGKLTRANEDLAGDSGYAIFVNRSDPPNRRRFTVAHEIGHFLLHRAKLEEGEIVDDTFFRSRLSNRLEAEANAAAAEILMPYHLLNAAAGHGNKRDVYGLAEIFAVSETAMKIRLGIPV